MEEITDFSATARINLKSSRTGNFRATFLGSGSAFTYGDGNYQSNILLEDLDSDRKLLLDCGGDIRFSLGEVNLTMADVTDVYISHLHADHIGGVEGLGFSTKWIPNRPKTKLNISAKFCAAAWNNSLQGGLSSIEGEIADLHTYFEVNSIGRLGRFDWQGIKFQLVQTTHIRNGFDIVPSYGLIFCINGITIFFTSDTQHTPGQLKVFYDMADFIWQDCETCDYSRKSGVHAHYEDIRRDALPQHKKKMSLYHYQPFADQRYDPVADGFVGFIKRGQQFHF